MFSYMLQDIFVTSAGRIVEKKRLLNCFQMDGDCSWGEDGGCLGSVVSRDWWFRQRGRLVPGKEGNILNLKTTGCLFCVEHMIMSTCLMKSTPFVCKGGARNDMESGAERRTLTLTMRQMSTSYRWWLIRCFNITLFTIGIKIWYCISKKKRRGEKSF